MGEQKETTISLGQLYDLCQTGERWQFRSFEVVYDGGTNLGSIESRAEILCMGITPMEGCKTVITMDLSWLLTRFPGDKRWHIGELLGDAKSTPKHSHAIGLVTTTASILTKLDDGSVRLVNPGGNEAFFYPLGHPDYIDYWLVADDAIRVSISILRLGFRARQH